MKIEITFRWRSIKPYFWASKQIKMIQISWLWFYVCITKLRYVPSADEYFSSMNETN